MSEELAKAAQDFQAHVTKQAGKWDGPWIDTDTHYVQVWVAFENYGRVHHVTGELNQAEKVLQKARQHFIGEQQTLAEQGILIRDIGDIYVDGLKGGRNKMVLDFSVRAQGQWTDEQQEAVGEALRLSRAGINGYKKAP